jgi:hypothetical protein
MEYFPSLEAKLGWLATFHHAVVMQRDLRVVGEFGRGEPITISRD